MKVPVKALKKIIKYCKKQDAFCHDCEIKELCDKSFIGIPSQKWSYFVNKLEK